MVKLIWIVSSLVILNILLGLLIQINIGLEEGYGIVNSDLQAVGDEAADKTILQRLEGLNFIEGINKITISVEKITAPGNVLDILGGLAAGALGILQTVTGVFTTIPEIIGIVMAYYQVPTIIKGGVYTLIATLGAFLLIGAYLRHNV